MKLPKVRVWVHVGKDSNQLYWDKTSYTTSRFAYWVPQVESSKRVTLITIKLAKMFMWTNDPSSKLNIYQLQPIDINPKF